MLSHERARGGVEGAGNIGQPCFDVNGFAAAGRGAFRRGRRGADAAGEDGRGRDFR